MHVNASCSFPLPHFEVLKSLDYFWMPKSNMLEISLNPFTGNVSFCYQKSTDTLAVLDLIFEAYNDFADAFTAQKKRTATFRDFVEYCNKLEEGV